MGRACMNPPRRTTADRGRSQSPRRERVGHQLAEAVFVERNHEKKIDFALQVVDHADCGDDHAGAAAVGHFQHR
jgi:hypothetical protein